VFGSDNCPYARADCSSSRGRDVDDIIACDDARAVSLRARRDALDASMTVGLCSARAHASYKIVDLWLSIENTATALIRFRFLRAFYREFRRR
jgi:hypothetical protein